jgi:hypothetical protein
MTDLPLETGTEYKNPGVTNAEYFNGIKKDFSNILEDR